MALIKTRDDLAKWAEYRKFLLAALRGLGESESFHVSKDEFDFTVKGKKWPGRVVLAGANGDSSMTSLKKAGIQFRSGTCRKDGKKLLVSGLSPGLLKSGNKTLQKLSLDFTAVPDSGAAQSVDAATDESTAGGDKAKAPQAQPAPEAVTGKQSSGAADLRELKARLTPRIREAVGGNPPNKAVITKLVGAAAKFEKAGDVKSATAALARLEQEIDKAQPSGTTAAAPAAPAGEVEADDDDEDVELDSLRDLLVYRKYLKVRCKRITADAEVPDPFYLSRKKVKFESGGKSLEAHALLLGRKAKKDFVTLKKQGILFLPPFYCHKSGKQLIVKGLPGAALKAAAKTIKALKIGYEVTSAGGVVAPEIEGGVVEYRKSLLSFAQTRTAVRTQLASLQSNIAAVPDEADLAHALATRIEGIFEQVGDAVDNAMNASGDARAPVTDAVRTELQRAIREVDGNELLAHVEKSPWGIRIKAPLLRALGDIQQAMPA